MLKLFYAVFFVIVGLALVACQAVYF